MLFLCPVDDILSMDICYPWMASCSFDGELILWHSEQETVEGRLLRGGYDTGENRDQILEVMLKQIQKQSAFFSAFFIIIFCRYSVIVFFKVLFPNLTNATLQMQLNRIFGQSNIKNIR